MKKILVLVADYPNNDGGVALMYVHTRNKYYIQHDIDVTVLNFSAKSNYVIDGIKVVSNASYETNPNVYDIAVCHASNIRNHYFFLKKYGRRFQRFVFFFHGHEILRLNQIYPKPFDYVKASGTMRKVAQDAYDTFKVTMWHHFFLKYAYKSTFIFVSNWLYEKFHTYVGLNESDLQNHVHIINNSVGRVFEENSYNLAKEKKYDFITIRSYMDDSKYCVDLVNDLAKQYPQYRFLVIGRGEFYTVHQKPDNVTWVDRFLSHKEIMDYIDESKCGLLLTRQDTQGVMTCELAVYGIPVITSDIAVCHEICDDLENVALVSNDLSRVHLPKVYSEVLTKYGIKKSQKFSYVNTVKKEEELIKGI